MPEEPEKCQKSEQMSFERLIFGIVCEACWRIHVECQGPDQVRSKIMRRFYREFVRWPEFNVDEYAALWKNRGRRTTDVPRAV